MLLQRGPTDLASGAVFLGLGVTAIVANANRLHS